MSEKRQFGNVIVTRTMRAELHGEDTMREHINIRNLLKQQRRHLAMPPLDSPPVASTALVTG
jgi:hypothetical protein